MLGREAEALEHARLATNAIRLPDLEMLLAMMRGRETECLLRQQLLDDAEAAVAEMFSLLEDNFRWDPLRARAHVLRAECGLSRGNTDEADADLERALTLLEPMAPMVEAAGFQFALATCWSAKARLRATRGDQLGAIDAWREAVRISGQVATLPQLEGVYASFILTEMLKGLSIALAAGGMTEQSVETKVKRMRLRRQLGLPLSS